MHPMGYTADMVPVTLGLTVYARGEPTWEGTIVRVIPQDQWRENGTGIHVRWHTITYRNGRTKKVDIISVRPAEVFVTSRPGQNNSSRGT